MIENEDGQCKEQIHYSVSLSVEHRDGSKMVEFAIDTDVTATCSYCSSITMRSDGFIANQEDTIVDTPGLGKFDELFTCRFYTDPKFQNEILSHDLVNMGTTVYGRVETDRNMLRLINSTLMNFDLFTTQVKQPRHWPLVLHQLFNRIER